MTAKQQNPALKWFWSNLFNLLVLVGGMILAWGALNARVNAIETKVAEYPSQDWFELKFDGIDSSIAALQKKVDANTLIIRSQNNEGITVVAE